MLRYHLLLWAALRSLAARRSMILLAVLVLGSMSTGIDAVAQASGVSAGMKRVGQEISLELVIKAPAPSALILYLTMPKSYKMIGSSPRADSYEPDKGMAKWLIRKPRPGHFILKVRFDNRVELDKLEGKIRYKDPDTGEKITVEIKNRGR